MTLSPLLPVMTLLRSLPVSEIASVPPAIEVFDIRREGVADNGVDGVGAGICAFDDVIAGVLDDVGVVAETAGKDVDDVATAVEDVVAAGAFDVLDADEHVAVGRDSVGKIDSDRT